GKKTIVLDPGHGGIDPGAISRAGTKEKDVVLSFANVLRQALLASGKYNVVMTRSDDRFVSLKNRVTVAREKNADLFLAIHADTVRGRDARGVTIYTLSDKASDAEAEALAKRENRADIIGGLDLEAETEEITDILIDLAQRESKNHAMFFSKKAVAQLRPLTLMTGKPLRSAGFMVLKAPDVPSVLLELGFLSSKSDEKLLTSTVWQSKIARAFATAIDSYFATEVASTAN
ncbi:MAG: N-acetylmuramoyl-L-alanine amidase, partial [Hyphomicrobiales bacterium]|nr:N-acetylmuramoyl-L-alanine amidase [Hyphomicrobiales bacterium]